MNFLIQILLSIALTVASSLIQQHQAAQNQRKVGPNFRGQYSSGGTEPLKIVLGTYGVPGHLEYSNAYGNDGETPHAFLADVLSLSDHLITAVSALWVDSNPVTLQTAASDSNLGYTVPGYELSSKDYLGYRFLDGSQTTVSTYLTGKFGSDANYPWEDEMVGEGIAQAIMTARINEVLFTGFPSYMFEVQGAPVFDPRLSTAAGGSGSHVWGTISTYAFSDNPVVLIYNILRGIHDKDGNHIYGGRATEYQLPYEVWADAMDACDAAVDKKGGGTEKRYRAGIEIGVDELPADVINVLKLACNARITYHHGQYFVLVDVPGSADGSFSDSDLLIDHPINFAPFPDINSVINGASATFLAPERAWEEKEITPYYNADLEEEDDDRRLVKELKLRCVFSGTQAQRIAKAVVKESRRFRRHIVVLRHGYSIYRPLQVLAWTSEEFQYTSKLFLVSSMTEDEFANVILVLQEIDPDDFDWDAETDETDLVFSPLAPIRPPAQSMTGWGVSAYTDTANRRFGIEITYTGGLDDVRAVRVQIREAGGSKPVVFDSGATDYDITDADPVTRKISGAFMLPATGYEVRGRFLAPDGSGRDTNWSSWLSVTTDDVTLSADDLPPIEVSMLGHELFNAHGILTGDDPAAVPALIAQLLRRQDELALAVIDANATTKEVLRVLAAQHNGANAAIIENSLAIVSETGARAAAITEAIATFGDGIGAWWGEVSATKNSKTVTRVTGPSFTDGNCAAGATITINTAAYTVASRTNGNTLQITANFTGDTGTKDAIIKPFVDVPEEFTLADGYLEIDAAANPSDATATVTAKVRARAGDDVSQAGWILKAFADGSGGTIEQFGVLGTFHIFQSELDDGIPVFSVDGDGNVHAKAITFDEVLKSKKKSSGTPLIYLDGGGGGWSLGSG